MSALRIFGSYVIVVNSFLLAPNLTACTAPFQSCEDTKTCPVPSKEAGVQTGGTQGSGGMTNPTVGGSGSGGLSSRGAGGTTSGTGGRSAPSTDRGEHERDAAPTNGMRDASVDAAEDANAEAGGALPGCSGANVAVWYQDCDGDGYSPSIANGGISSCVPPPTTTSCIAWTTLKPTDKTNTDCNDHSTTYHPGADFDFRFVPPNIPPSDSTEYDLNCDGKAELEPNYALGPFAIFNFVVSKQYVSFCGDASYAGCCVTSSQGIEFCCGCDVGVHVECGGYRGDTSGYFLCR